jgi:2-keto-3-deoxy-L-rhamnonate aldolase RhmA
MAGMSRASRFGTTPDYFKNANAAVAVVLQLETEEALRNLETIAAVEGVDALFLGPADLSGSMGYPGQLAHPLVMKLMADAVERCKALGILVGTVGGSPEMVAQYRAIGFDYVAIASDLGLMMRACQAAITALQSQPAEQVHSVNTGTAPQGY